MRVQPWLGVYMNDHVNNLGWQGGVKGRPAGMGGRGRQERSHTQP